jgi:hypothetical protein
MRVAIDVPECSATRGLQLVWDDGFELEVRAEGDAIVLRGNAAGMRSLARHLLHLSQESVPVGSHLHLDAENCLAEGSLGFIVERVA